MSPRRAEILGDLEQEVGAMVRRIRRVIAARARAVHPELAPASYLMLAFVAEKGPMRASVIAEQFDMDKGAISRHVTHLTDLGSSSGSRTPRTAERCWSPSATTAGPG